MKKQNKGLKLNKAVVSELGLEKAGDIKGGISAPHTWCVNRSIGCNVISRDIPCEPSVNVC